MSAIPTDNTPYRATRLVWTILLMFCQFGTLSAQQSSIARANTSLVPLTISYRAETDFLTAGKATLTLSQGPSGAQPESWQLQLQTKPSGVFKFSRRGKITERSVFAKLTPPFRISHYSYRQKGNQKRSYSARFNHDNQSIAIERHGGASKIKTVPVTMDRVTVMLALIHQLEMNPNFESTVFQVLSASGIRPVHYKRVKTDTIETKTGTHKAIVIERYRPGSYRSTLTWFAEVNIDEYDHKLWLPLKVEQYKRGDLSLRLVATAFKTLE